MATSTEKLFDQAFDLGERERAALASLLIESLDREAEEGVEAAWLAEIERRVADCEDVLW
jgi:putative addiction module component